MRCLTHFPPEEDMAKGGWMRRQLTFSQRFLPEDQQPVTEYIKVPFGFSSFPKELIPVPKVWAQTQGNLVFYREHSKVSFPLSLFGGIESLPRWQS